MRSLPNLKLFLLDGNSIFYVTYQDGPDSDLPTTLVQILDEPSLPENETIVPDSAATESLDSSLVLTDQASQLQLESFADSETLTLNAGQLQVYHRTFKNYRKIYVFFSGARRRR